MGYEEDKLTFGAAEDKPPRQCVKCGKRLYDSHVHTCTPMTATEVRERVSALEPPDASKIMEPLVDQILGLSTDAATRKATPIFSGVLRYFPDALAAVAELSRIGNEQHNPGEPLHWARSKSGDEYDALTRHLMEVGTIDTDGVRHATKVVWRALAGLQKEIEMAAGIDKSDMD